ncbi:hypothetical protein KEJ26_02135 [Candidatus Bathyarchaeota archaeon]|nr:hypothetical protein [Candidatus Bathyarchaeota archaeon]
MAVYFTYVFLSPKIARVRMEKARHPFVVEVDGSQIVSFTEEETDAFVILHNPVMVTLIVVWLTSLVFTLSHVYTRFNLLQLTEEAWAASVIIAGAAVLASFIYEFLRYTNVRATSPPVVLISQKRSNSSGISCIKVDDYDSFDEHSLMNAVRRKLYSTGEFPFIYFINANMLREGVRRVVSTLVRGTEIKPGLAEMADSHAMIVTPICPYETSDESFREQIDLMLARSPVDSSADRASILAFDLRHLYGPDTGDASITHFRAALKNLVKTIILAYESESEQNEWYTVSDLLRGKILIPAYPIDEVFFQRNAELGLDYLINSILTNDLWVPVNFAEVETVVALVIPDERTADNRIAIETAVQAALMDFFRRRGVTLNPRDSRVIIGKTLRNEVYPRVVILLGVSSMKSIKWSTVKV